MKIIFTNLALLLFLSIQAQITLVKDINVGTDQSYPTAKCVYNGYVYFAASTGVGLSNKELWRSDGTDAGTTLVKDINPAVNASGSPAGMIVFNNALFFSANNGTNGIELWKSDGTADGTVMLKDIVSGVNGSEPAEFTIFNNALYFTVISSTNGRKIALWKTDGTANGTVVVKEIITVSVYTDMTRLKVSGTKLFFWATTDTEGTEPWVSDGTTAGTNLIKDIFTGSTGSPGPSVDYNFTPDGNGGVYFKAAGNTALTDRELWKSDGTAAGTVLVKDIYPGTFSSELDGISKVLINGILYFTASDPNFGKELWRSDGSAAGTYMVKDIYQGNYLSSEAYIIGVVGNTIYLQATTPGYLRELWKSDGTEAGTVLVKDIYTGMPNSGMPGNSGGRETFSTGNSLLFRATTGSTGIELWRTDGTEAGTVMIQDLQPGATGTDPNSFILLGSTIMFNDNPTATNVELYKLDLSALPLKWLSFSASSNSKKQVELLWKVTEEINVKHYEIEWGTDGIRYTTISNLPYNKGVEGKYSAIHANPTIGNNYYRIRQVDVDGRFTFSKLQLLKFTDKTDILFYPIPSRDMINIIGWSDVKQMQLYDVNGRKVNEWLVPQPSLNVKNLSNGTYVLIAHLTSGEIIQQKILISK